LKSLRIGCVKYLNARPLIREWNGDVCLETPAVLCRKLASGELDVALVSSFEFLRNPIYAIVDGISISSDGPVYSVFVAHRGSISEIEEIELDPASETSVNLLRCLLAERRVSPRLVVRDGVEKRVQREVLGNAESRPERSRTGCRPAVAGGLPATSADVLPSEQLIDTSRQAAETDRLAAHSTTAQGRLCAPQTSFSAADAQLLIGDQAIRFRRDHPEFQFWDLGAEWKKSIGPPFVYALWLIRPEVSDAKAIADRLRALRDRNLANLDALIAAEEDFDHEFCKVYYRENLRFHFGEKEKEGLQVFQKLCAKHGLLPKREIEFALV
jgi:predicted solute-binding protein